MHHLHTSYADVTSDKHDGWPPMQHARFEKLRGEYPPEMRGRHALWLERARMEFPRFTVKQIEAHEAWTARQIAYKSRRRSLRNAFRQHMDALVHLTLQQYAEASQVYAVHAAQMCDREERLHRLEATQDKLKRWRDQRVQQLRLAAEQRHRAIEAQLELEHARAEHETRRRAAERERIAAYFAHKQALVAKQLEAAKRVEAALALEREARRPVNEERVALRESLRLQKIEERKAAVEEARERQRELERQLDALRRTVAVDAKSDWGRILADTTATAEHKKPVDEPDWFKNYSFSTESVLKDKRAQLSVALHRHGLQGNEYARQILAAMQPKHARPEQASSVQLG
nr:hypothetical protein HK105_000790 [Polyrhizophydium stewartii]